MDGKALDEPVLVPSLIRYNRTYIVKIDLENKDWVQKLL